MGAGWTCVVLSDGGDVELEQLDEAGLEWYATGPGGDHMGGLAEALTGALGDPAPDSDWLVLVTATIEQRDRGSHWRSIGSREPEADGVFLCADLESA